MLFGVLKLTADDVGRVVFSFSKVWPIDRPVAWASAAVLVGGVGDAFPRRHADVLRTTVAI